MEHKFRDFAICFMLLLAVSCRQLSPPLDTSTAPSVTLTQTPISTWTPLPTLPTSEAADLVQDLLTKNSGCRLPCWWGITPGETSWQEAQQFLTTFATRIGQGQSGVIVEDGMTYEVTNYSVTYRIKDVSEGGGVSFSTRNGIISTIYVGTNSTLQSYQLYQLLSEYGIPEKVLINTYNNSPSDFLPFSLALFYSNYRILASFEFEAKKEGKYLRGCPQTIGPFLQLWRPDRIWTVQDIELAVSGPDSTNPLRPLGEVTNMSIDDFYETFKNPENKSCIETPADFWQ
jgi:hypothetical protein